MSRRPISRGTCVFCRNSYARSGIVRHLKACPSRQEAVAAEEAAEVPKMRLFHLAVKGTYASDSG